MTVRPSLSLTVSQINASLEPSVGSLSGSSGTEAQTQGSACARGSGHANFAAQALSPGVSRCWATSKVILESTCHGATFHVLTLHASLSTFKGEMKKSI